MVLATVDTRQDACLSLSDRALGGSETAAQLIHARLHSAQGVGVCRRHARGSLELGVALRQRRVQLPHRGTQLHVHRLEASKTRLALRHILRQRSDSLFESAALGFRGGYFGSQLLELYAQS